MSNACRVPQSDTLPSSVGERRYSVESTRRLVVPGWRVPAISPGRPEDGRIGATGEGILIEDIKRDHDWIARPDWVRTERLSSFGGQPLVFRNEVLGVLGLFNRDPCDRRTFAWLRTFADHAAIAIAHARALDEIQHFKEQLELENTYLREDVRSDARDGMIGSNPALRKVLEQVAISPPRPPRCSSKANQAPARNSSLAPFTIAAPATRNP